MTDAPSQTARPSGDPAPERQDRVPESRDGVRESEDRVPERQDPPNVPAGRDNPRAPRPAQQPTPPVVEETQPVVDDTIPAPDDLTDSSSVDLSRIAWSITTIAFLIAMVVLGLRGDMGYAGVTLAVAVAAAINLFSWGSQ
ncbi:MAG TPA: hypothetical protein VG321_06625 [Solirubrobacteraceae bacterium]|nr:hypothetical protein [Solirubrobacteraceae bacterium]